MSTFVSVEHKGIGEKVVIGRQKNNDDENQDTGLDYVDAENQGDVGRFLYFYLFIGILF